MNEVRPGYFLVIDDHELFRVGLELILKQHFPGREVLSFPGFGTALDSLRQGPDLVLLDLKLRGVGGEAGLALIRTLWPDSRVIVVTSEQDRTALDRVRNQGADLVVSKAEPPQRLVEAIRSVLPRTDNSGEETPSLAFSRRQMEVLTHLSEGLSNKAIARVMGLSEFTVRGHVQQIIRITGAANRSNAVFIAKQAGLL